MGRAPSAAFFFCGSGALLLHRTDQEPIPHEQGRWLLIKAGEYVFRVGRFAAAATRDGKLTPPAQVGFKLGDGQLVYLRLEFAEHRGNDG